MTKSWNVACSVLTLGLLLISAPTRAAISVVDLGNVIPVSDPVTALADEFWLDDPGDFLDYYAFDIDGLGSPQIVIDVQADNLFAATTTIPLTLALYKWNTGTNDYEIVASNGPANAVSLNAIPVENGLVLGTTYGRRYLIGVSGSAPSGEGVTSGYSGILTVTAIPEPSTVAFLLAGLGVLGMTKTRKSSCSGSVRV
jgi:hypothetical protein